MEAKELRIGNWVNNSDSNMTVRQIFVNTVLMEDTFKSPKGRMMNMLCRENLTEVTPIPLTEEWLIKFGFVDNRLALMSLFMYDNKDWKVSWYDHTIKLNLKYVSHLTKPILRTNRRRTMIIITAIRKHNGNRRKWEPMEKELPDLKAIEIFRTTCKIRYKCSYIDFRYKQ